MKRSKHEVQARKKRDCDREKMVQLGVFVVKIRIA